MTATLVTQSVSEAPPAGYAISATYDTNVPVFRPFPTCVSALQFRLAGGGINVDITPISCGDFGIAGSLLLKLFTPGVLEVGLTGLLGFGFLVIHNVGSNRPPLPDLRMTPAVGPWTQNVFPRSIPAGPLKFSLTYQTPGFTGVIPARWLRFPFTWLQPVLRTPTLSLRGPTTVSLDADAHPPSTAAVFNTVTGDFVAPSFEWSLNNAPVPGHAVARITMAAPGLTLGRQRTFTVRVGVIDGMDNPLGQTIEASTQTSVVGTVRRVRETR